MPSDYENGAKKTIDISIKAEKMTADVLKSALQEFMSGNQLILRFKLDSHNLYLIPLTACKALVLLA